MQRIIVIGCPGSGKTTFAIKLRDKIGLSLYHLDAIWHKSDRTHISREEFDARLGEIMALDFWIIDGNYSRTVERRIEACATVFLFEALYFGGECGVKLGVYPRHIGSLCADAGFSSREAGFHG